MTNIAIERNEELISALNNAAVFIQQSKLSEDAVLATVSEQLTELGMRGGIALLDTSGEKINFLALAQPRKLQRLFRKLEGITSQKTHGFEIDIKTVAIFKSVIDHKQAVFLENSQEILADILPNAPGNFSKLVQKYYSQTPGIFTPLIRDNQAFGLLNISGEGLTPADVPVVQIFANHISIALENAQLFSSLREALESKDLTESKFRSLIEQSPLSTVTYTPEGKTIYGNQASLDLWGITEDVKDLLYTNYNILEDEQLEKLGILSDIKRGFQGEFVETPPIKYDPTETDPEYIGPVRWLKANIYPVRDDQDSIREVVVIHEDITSSINYQEALRESEERLRTLVDNVNLGIYRSTIDPDRIIEANPALNDILGYDAIEDLEHISISSFYADPADRYKLISELRSKGFVKDKDLQLIKRDGSEIWVRLNTTAKYGEEGEILWLDGVLEDITDKKRAEDQLQFDAFHDPLTKLPNRLLFIDRLKQAIGRARRKKDYLYAVLFMDLDRFKNINDSLGHEVGDIALCMVGQRLLECVREVDTVARFSGDEFIILFDEISTIQNAIDITNRMLTKLEEPMEIQDHAVQVTGSFGIAYHSEKYQTHSEVIRDADIAMYRAKATGKNRYEIFDNTMLEQVMDRIRIEAEMRRGIDKEQFVVHYQPIMNLLTMDLIGFESLVRWNRPGKGIVPPNEFLLIAEETGMIIDLGKIVIESVTMQLARWIQQYEEAAHLPVTINLSVKQFLEKDILKTVEAKLRESDLVPQNLRIEITESSIMDDTRQSLAMIQDYHSLGIDILLDDFGSGYSSLSYLHQYSFDGIKIDQSFIKTLTNTSNDINLVNTIISLGRNLKMDVIAEGIENEEQLDMLKRMGCAYGQGYLISYPMSAVDAEKFLINHLNSLGHLSF